MMSSGERMMVYGRKWRIGGKYGHDEEIAINNKRKKNRASRKQAHKSRIINQRNKK